jgi:hypothetical protein
MGNLTLWEYHLTMLKESAILIFKIELFQKASISEEFCSKVDGEIDELSSLIILEVAMKKASKISTSKSKLFSINAVFF